MVISRRGIFSTGFSLLSILMTARGLLRVGCVVPRHAAPMRPWVTTAGCPVTLRRKCLAPPLATYASASDGNICERLTGAVSNVLVEHCECPPGGLLLLCVRYCVSLL